MRGRGGRRDPIQGEGVNQMVMEGSCFAERLRSVKRSSKSRGRRRSDDGYHFGSGMGWQVLKMAAHTPAV